MAVAAYSFENEQTAVFAVIAVYGAESFIVYLQGKVKLR